MKIKYYELNCGVKATEEEIKNGVENGCEINRGLIDTEYSIAIKSDHYPTFEEAEEFIKDDLKKLDMMVFMELHHYQKRNYIRFLILKILINGKY